MAALAKPVSRGAGRQSRLIMTVASFLNQLLPRTWRPPSLAAARLVSRSGHVVQGGPFRGMRYIDRAHCSALAPKIAGTYEMEIHGYLPRLFAGSPDVFVDAGAAEGYYAIGALFAGWCERVIAFEAEPAAYAACRELMTLNEIGPEKLDLRGTCHPAALQEVLAKAVRPALMMDVEGYEAFLLDPLRVPALARCRILLEYHDFVLPGLSAELDRRMSPTHHLTPIALTPRRATDMVTQDWLLRLLPGSIRQRALAEDRPFEAHGWLWMEPRIN